MSAIQPYFPQAVFEGRHDDPQTVPRVLISPHRYIQGRDSLDRLGRYISILPSKRPLVLISAGGRKRFGEKIRRSLEKTGANGLVRIFKGECSHEAVDAIALEVKQEAGAVDAVIAVGGGKCLDAGKCVAFRLDVPVVICPTIASTDAPCSAASVMYTEDGVGKGPEFFPNSPAMVIVDTAIILASPIRHLVAGMGDALATCYEARTCFNNPRARSMVGGRPTIAVLAIGELCAKTIYEKGLDAVRAVTEKTINEALEQIIEANTLLSGIGFESGGLAAAHAIAAGLTVIPALHSDYLHGELVGMGLVAHLILEDNPKEARRAAEFLARVGLPVHLGQLALNEKADAALIGDAMRASVDSGLAASEPFAVTARKLGEAFAAANRLGLQVAADLGDEAYRMLHT